jgi:hypothetical protein
MSLNGNQARVAEAAERVFGDSDFAHKWLTGFERSHSP